LLLACGEELRIEPGGGIAGWPEYGGDAGGTRYSPLAQITRENVEHLEVAWTYRTGDIADGSRSARKGSFEATPILFEGALYLSTPFNRVVAIDAETGDERWSFDPKIDLSVRYSDFTSRGVAAWRDAARAPGEPCAARIFHGTNDARLIALDARTGAPCADFGAQGQVDLAVGVSAIHPWEYGVSSPPLVIGDRVLVGSKIADNVRVDAPSGVVRAFDARSGALGWSWDPVPPGASPREPDPDAAGPRYQTGTPNAWSIFSADAERDLVFIPTGNASPDYVGAERHGLDAFASSVVALRGSTGEVVWQFQTVHHDLWDYDVPSQPTLFTLRRGGAEIPALVQATKMGHLFFLHRETGEPLFPVEERPVPATTVPGESSWPTQPFPTKPRPLVPQSLSPEDAWGITPWDRGACRDRIAALRFEGIFTPPSLEGTIAYPGNGGGSNWGSVAFDPERQLVIANSMNVPFVVTLIPREEFPDPRPRDPQVEYAPQHGTRYGLRRQTLLSPLGLPCNPPPWGSIAAVDAVTGDVVWDVPFGTTRGQAPFPFWFGWGVPGAGGPIATAGGLVFIGAALDGYLRAFDVETGAELWKTHLPAGGQATPMTYRLRPDGPQYVVIAAGGYAKVQTEMGDYVIAFALPR
jgi:quinoprotein glucose dehydrogenase